MVDRGQILLSLQFLLSLMVIVLLSLDSVWLVARLDIAPQYVVGLALGPVKVKMEELIKVVVL